MGVGDARSQSSDHDLNPACRMARAASFEKTDVFIEKSVNTSFDVLDVAPIKSLIDFGKFIFKEKVKTP